MIKKYNIYSIQNNTYKLYSSNIQEVNSRAACILSFEQIEKTTNLVVAKQTKQKSYIVTDGKITLELTTKEVNEN